MQQTSGGIELVARWKDKQGTRGTVKATHPIVYPVARYRACTWIPLAGLSTLHDDKKSAEDRVYFYRRMVSFINATGLKPSRAHWDYLGVKYGQEPPGVDHTLFWHDGKKNYAVTTDPYGGEYHLGAMQEWCDRKGWRIAAAPEGVGLWYHGTTLMVLAPPKSGIDVDRIVDQSQRANCAMNKPQAPSPASTRSFA